MFAPILSLPAPAVSDAASTPPVRQPPVARPDLAARDDRVARSQETALQALMSTIRQAEPALPSTVRAELDVDKASDRVVARVVSTLDGEVVRQYPPEETLHMLARAREQFGHLLKAEA